MSDFLTAKRAVAQNYELFSTSMYLFTVDSDKDKIWELYLNGFPTEERLSNSLAVRYLAKIEGILSSFLTYFLSSKR